MPPRKKADRQRYRWIISLTINPIEAKISTTVQIVVMKINQTNALEEAVFLACFKRKYSIAKQTNTVIT